MPHENNGAVDSRKKRRKIANVLCEMAHQLFTVRLQPNLRSETKSVGICRKGHA
jgi:hypothetical protein